MYEPKRKGVRTGQAQESVLLESDSDLTFYEWLITTRGIGEKWGKVLDSYVSKILRDYNCPFPTKNDAEQIAVKILSDACSKSHQRHRLQALEYYCGYRGLHVKFRKPRATKRNPKYITEAQMKALIRSSRDYREYTLLNLLCTTGIRLNELRMLDVGDVNLGEKYLSIKHAKRDRDREIPLSDNTCRILATYIQKYHLGSKNTMPLFLSARSNRWSAHAIGDAIKRCAKRIGMEGVSPHVLRHSFATAMIGNGCDLFHLSHMLGHSDLSTTSIYLHINDKAMRSAFERGVPKL